MDCEKELDGEVLEFCEQKDEIALGWEFEPWIVRRVHVRSILGRASCFACHGSGGVEVLTNCMDVYLWFRFSKNCFGPDSYSSWSRTRVSLRYCIA